MLIWYFLQGYAIIELEAANINKALFRISRAGIELVRVSRISYTVMRAQVSRKNLQRLRKLLQNEAQIRIRQKKGIWGWYTLGKQHVALGIGLMLTVAAIILLSSCCLRIEVVGNQEVSEYDIYHTAVENGAKLFALKNKEILQEVEQALWERFPELTYVYTSYEGACLRIVVREKYKSPEIHETQPCSIYADKAGVITDITVFSGRAMVQVGDRVAPGDLLIAGSYAIDEQEFNVHAAGKVTAQVEYISSALLQDTYYQLEPTGKKAYGRIMQLGEHEILIDGENPFAYYPEERSLGAVVGENSPLYLKIYHVVYLEAKKVYSEQKKQEAVLEQQEKAYFETALQLNQDSEIIGFDTYEVNTERGLRLIFTLSAKESIGKADEINMPESVNIQS